MKPINEIIAEKIAPVMYIGQLLETDSFKYYEEDKLNCLEPWQYWEPADLTNSSRYELDREAYLKTFFNPVHLHEAPFRENLLLQRLINNLSKAKHPVFIEYKLYLEETLRTMETTFERHVELELKSIIPLSFCGKVIIHQLEVNSFEKPFEIRPTRGSHNSETCSQCSIKLKEVTAKLTEGFEGKLGRPAFPHCCQWHMQLLAKSTFDRGDFLRAPAQVARKIFYTYDHIINHIDNENWKAQCFDYIDWAFTSLGHFPEGCGEPLFAGQYLQYVTGLIEKAKGIPDNKKRTVLEYLERFTKEETEKADSLQALLETYEKWYSLFPFQIQAFFDGLQEPLFKALPFIKSKTRKNLYSRIEAFEFYTKVELVEKLIDTTNKLLSSINSQQFYEQGLIPNHERHHYQLLTQAHRVSQQALVGKFNAKEITYANVLAAWLENERKFFEAFPFEGKEIRQTKAELLEEVIAQHGFYELPLVKSLSANNRQVLIKQLNAKELPYQVAMLDYLGFIKHLADNYFNTKNELYMHLSKWLNSDSAGRTVKGNLSTLAAKSKEDKRKYTAHLHKQTVRNDYQKLK